MIETLRTLFRASAAEAGERLADANGTTLLGQHLRDAQADLRRARHAVAQLVARREAEGRRITGLDREIAEREQQARTALEREAAELAGDLADRIAALEDQRDTARRVAGDLEARIGTLRASLQRADDRIARLASDLRAARASKLARATGLSLAMPPDESALERAEAAAERLRETTAFRDDADAALAALATPPADGFEARLTEAGIPSADQKRRDAILARLAPAARPTSTETE